MFIALEIYDLLPNMECNKKDNYVLGVLEQCWYNAMIIPPDSNQSSNICTQRQQLITLPDKGKINIYWKN